MSELLAQLRDALRVARPRLWKLGVTLSDAKCGCHGNGLPERRLCEWYMRLLEEEEYLCAEIERGLTNGRSTEPGDARPLAILSADEAAGAAKVVTRGAVGRLPATLSEVRRVFRYPYLRHGAIWDLAEANGRSGDGRVAQHLSDLATTLGEALWLGRVFVCHASEDGPDVQALKIACERLARTRHCRLDLWIHEDDSDWGEAFWEQTIVPVITHCDIALLVISRSFWFKAARPWGTAREPFIWKHELPRLLERQGSEGMLLLPLILSRETPNGTQPDEELATWITQCEDGLLSLRAEPVEGFFDWLRKADCQPHGGDLLSHRAHGTVEQFYRDIAAKLEGKMASLASDS